VLFGLEERPPHMGQTARQHDGRRLRAAGLGPRLALAQEARIPFVAIGLKAPGEVQGHDLFEHPRRPRGSPMKEPLPLRPEHRPEITLLGLPVARLKVTDHRFINLRVAPGEGLCAQHLADGFQPKCAQFHHPSQTLAREFHAMAEAVMLSCR